MVVVANALVAPRCVCCTSAAAVGGIASIDLALVLKICFLAESTLISVQVRSYSSTTQDSSTDMQASLILVGCVDKVKNTGVTSLKDFQMSNAVFSPPNL